MRPANHPKRRIAGLAALLSKYLDSGLLSGLLIAAQGAKPGQLISALQGAEPDCRGLIGAGRARDMAVNVVLPFFHALAGWSNSARVSEVFPEPDVFLDTYRSFGTLQDNELLREMKDLLLEPHFSVPLNTARRQQGLLHLHHLLRGGG